MKNNNILILVPTRSGDGNRPNTLNRLIESWQVNSNDSSEMCVILDKDDAHNYQRVNDVDLFYLTVGKMNLVNKLNAACLVDYGVDSYLMIDDYDVVAFMGDDHIIKTKGFEKPILDWINSNNGVGVCYGNDLLQGENLPTSVFITTNIIKELGFMCPPGLKHMFIDNFWKDLGLRLGCLKYFPDVIIEHRHWSNGKADKDKQYERVNNYMEEDRKIFDYYRANLMDADIQRIKNKLNG